MGNILFDPTPVDYPDYSIPCPADIIQKRLLNYNIDNDSKMDLENNEDNNVKNTLPRSKKVDGRFVLDEKHFPNLDHDGSFKYFWKWRRTIEEKVIVPPQNELEEKLPVLPIDKDKLENPPQNKMQVTWLGHASVLVQWDGWNVVADPIFSHRCAPVQFAGPARVRPSPVKNVALDLPQKIDVIVISHNHYDHLDYQSVQALAKRKPAPIFFVPLGMKSWMTSCGVRNCVELDWADEALIIDEDFAMYNNDDNYNKLNNDKKIKNRPPLTIGCLPCQHWCARTPTDRNKCLWSSWICFTNNAKYFFGGDTGYCGEIFQKVGMKYKPIHFSAIPIGAYGSVSERWFHKVSHMNPDEAVKCHNNIGSKKSLGIHWGTFQLTAEDLFEPPVKLNEAKKANNVDENDFFVMNHGETVSFMP